MKPERIVFLLIGGVTGLLAYFLFDFHFWQSIAVAWLIGSLFSFLTAILLAVKGIGSYEE